MVISYYRSICVKDTTTALRKKDPRGKEVPDVSLRGNNPPTVGRRYTDVESKKDPRGKEVPDVSPSREKSTHYGRHPFGNGVWEPVGPFCFY